MTAKGTDNLIQSLPDGDVALDSLWLEEEIRSTEQTKVETIHLWPEATWVINQRGGNAYR